MSTAAVHGHEIDVKKHVRTYVMVFVALAFLTMVTVAVSTLHLTKFAAIAVALLIACVKGSLVACYFMHLISEKKLIYSVLVLTVVFFAGLMAIPTLTDQDMIRF